MSIAAHLDMIYTLFQNIWPRVDNSDYWAAAFYSSHQELEHEWASSAPGSLHNRIAIGELDLVRRRVEDWHARYEEWVKGAEERLDQLSESDRHFDMVQAASSRVSRILLHVDAILSK